jgi:hypothetical protein
LGALELLVFPLLGAKHSALQKVHGYQEPGKFSMTTETETFKKCIYGTDV